MNDLAELQADGAQQDIWSADVDIPFHSANQASPYVGAWAEEIVAALWGGRRVKIQAHRDCPDVELASGHYAEVKAVSARRSFALYRPRYEQYKRWARHNSKLWFVLVVHDCRSQHFQGRHHMRQLVADRLQHVVLLSAQTVLREVDRLLAQNGGWLHAPHRAAAYQDYVILGPKWVRQFTDAKPHRPRRTFSFDLHGVTIPQVMFRAYKCTPPGSPAVGWHPAARRDAAALLLSDLAEHRLDVYVNHDTCQRVVSDQNPEWYRRLCAEYPAEKARDYTVIQRRNVLNALEQIVADRPVRGRLEEQLLPYLSEAEDRLQDLAELDDPWGHLEAAPF